MLGIGGKISSYWKYFGFLFLFFYAFSLHNRILNIDDPWLAELSYWIGKVGYARSTLWTGINGYEIIDVNYHKLFVLTGTLFMKLFGFSLSVFKSVGLFYYLIFLVGFWYYFRLRNKDFTKEDFLIAVFLLWSTNLVFNYSFVFRPEIAIMALGFWGFIYFRKAILTTDNGFLFIAGIFFGLCICLHLKGLVYVLTSGAYLVLFSRKVKQLLSLSIGCVVGVLPYFWDINSWQRLQIWQKQINNNPVVVGMPKSIFWYLLKPLEEHKRFFHQEHEIAFSLLFFVALIMFYRPIRDYLKIEIRFLLLTVFFMGLTSHSMTDKSLLLYYPFMVMTIVTAIKVMPKNTKSIKILLVLSLLVNMAMNIRIVKESVDVAARSQIAADQIGKKNIKVMADISFIFNQIENFEIYSANNYTFVCSFYTHEKPTMDKYFEYVDRFGVDYIVLDRIVMSGEQEELFKEVDFSEGVVFRGFLVKYNRDGITVLERRIN